MGPGGRMPPGLELVFMIPPRYCDGGFGDVADDTEEES